MSTKRTFNLLSTPGKMPGFSFSLPAGRACPASKLANKQAGSASTCHACYAQLGFYTYPSVQEAQEQRYQFVLRSLKENNGDAFVEAMIVEIMKHPRKKYFRIHDSGDFFSPAYVECWYRICAALLEWKFWAPTREWIRPTMLPSLRKLASLPNVVVRPSAIRIDDPPPVVEGLHAGSGVALEADDDWQYVCPSTATDQKHCDDHACRRCWDPEIPVMYVIHGGRANKIRRELTNA